MKLLRSLLEKNEEWFKNQILEYVVSHGAESGDVTADWAAFFANLKHGLVDLAPDTPPSTGLHGRFPTLFEQMDMPMFILDDELNLGAMNKAAAMFIGRDLEPGELEYARECFLEPSPPQSCESKSLTDYLPWLAESLRDTRAFGKIGQKIRYDIPVSLEDGERHYTVTVLDMPGTDDDSFGYAVVLDEISFGVEASRKFERERSRADHYLDIVGSMVVALDTSGLVTMINQAGCEVLGYEADELLGREWVDLVIPADQRGDIKEYLYLALSDDMAHGEEITNFVVTKSGAHRLIQWKNRLLTNEKDVPMGILCSGVDITEQQLMEDALAEKELWLRNTFVALGEGVLILSPNREILDANPAAETIFQMTNSELEGLPAGRLHVDGDHYEKFVQKTEAAFEDGRTARFEYVMRRSNGEVFPTEHSISMISGDDGSKLGLVSVIKDISARKRAEKVLSESEEKFRRIFESIEEGYMVTDLDGIINMVNPATCKLLFYDESNLIGKNIDLLYADEGERQQFREVVLEKGAVRGHQIHVSRADGASIVVEANAHLVLDDAGQPMALEGTFRDITNRIEAEKILRDREKQYRAFFENNHAIMLLVDPATDRIVDANPAASEFYGYPLDVLRAMELNEIDALSPEEIFMEMDKAREEGRTYCIHKHRLASGAVRDVEVYSGPISVLGKQLLYSVIHDVTQRISLERKMTKLATIDAMTGVNNRHQFFTLGIRELQRVKRYNSPLTVLMLDIDYFKSVNDTHGHQAGDLVLKMLAASAMSTLRASDIFGRLGGEEFAAILPETGLREGMEVAERLREAFSKLVARVRDAEITFTVSIGVTLVRSTDKTIEEVINRADEALYKAKRMGRNRVEQG
ncbi:sensor domain-containing diguanylate cyclase [Pseudodesulfovibrio sediminis]|uniref:Diguanylate cyclase with PAS/PAC sensor n=1 Tax=Pseudodesulfovibrio sediminis TaxID=2810563 RepID=A0ABN6EW00_9BACT|nr:PAS domain S-box protein [Pseudodesulfovibrio sediminis]BCS89434.1 hypothetical protein PSDVSF_26760 [Pseudodesulfovibrio sediminis]